MYTLSRPLIYEKNRFYFLAYSSAEPGTRVFRWTDEWNNYYVPFKTCGIAAVRGLDPAVLTIGVNGLVHKAGPGGFSEEAIDLSIKGPGHQGPLRGVSVIENEVYVVGLGRQVYKRDLLGVWKKIDDSIVQSNVENLVAGFESIAGFDQNEIYAVGMMGDMFWLNKNNWLKIKNFTNKILTKVICAPDGFVYIVGQDGIIIKGRNENWEVIEQNLTQETFWDVVWFDNLIWISTHKNLFRLDSQKKLEPISIKGSLNDFRYLTSYNDVMIASGSKQICQLTNNQWTMIQLPDFI